jgi:hypothetical protein
VSLRDGAVTTVHVAAFARTEYAPKVLALPRPETLTATCAARGVSHALVGGFFKRPEYEPLGELWLAGRAVPSHPFHTPWGEVRAALHVDGHDVRIARRDKLPATPAGDLLQAGPLLVAGGELAVAGDSDPEGFREGADQFDSDITRGRYPRAAIGLTDSHILAVACDGRTDADAGMTLHELGDLLVGLGADSALNLDGGGSTSLVHDGELRNRPREEHGVDLLGGRPIVTAIAFVPR